MENTATAPSFPENFNGDAQPPMQSTPKRNKKLVLFIGGLLLLSAVGVSSYFLGKNSPQTSSNVADRPASSPSPKAVACTLEAKVCPDGSSVGRTGPNCEFSACPDSATQNETTTHTGKYFTVTYPKRWIAWSFGRGVSLEYFQINSVAEELTFGSGPRTHVNFDIQDLNYTESRNLSEQRTYLEKINSEYPQDPYIISDTTVDGVPALVYERTNNDKPGDTHPWFEKTFWLVKGNVKYIISMSSSGSDVISMNKEKETYLGDFNEMVASFKIK